jgi:hypothetical protein
MTNQPTTSRFVLRKGAAEGKWMIWDRELRGPAKLERGFARELSEEQAQMLLGQLTRTVTTPNWDQTPTLGLSGSSQVLDSLRVGECFQNRSPRSDGRTGKITEL